MSFTSCAKEGEVLGRGEIRPSRDPSSMRTKSLRPTKIEVVLELSDEEEHNSSNFNRLTWSI